MSNKILFKICKYFFASYFLLLIYASILGKEGVQQYNLFSNLLLEEYIIIVISLMLIDIIKWIRVKI